MTCLPTGLFPSRGILSFPSLYTETIDREITQPKAMEKVYPAAQNIPENKRTEVLRGKVEGEPSLLLRAASPAPYHPHDSSPALTEGACQETQED